MADFTSSVNNIRKRLSQVKSLNLYLLLSIVKARLHTHTRSGRTSHVNRCSFVCYSRPGTVYIAFNCRCHSHHNPVHPWVYPVCRAAAPNTITQKNIQHVTTSGTWFCVPVGSNQLLWVLLKMILRSGNSQVWRSVEWTSILIHSVTVWSILKEIQRYTKADSWGQDH